MIFSLIFCLLNFLQPTGDRPVPHIIQDAEFYKEFDILNIMLYGKVYFLEELKPLTFLQARDKYLSGEFTKIPQLAKFDMGYQKSDYWFGLSVENRADEALLMDFGIYNSSIYKIDFFNFNESGELLESGYAGYSVPGQLKMLNGRTDNFKIELPPKSARVLLAKVDFNGSKSGTAFFLGDFYLDVRDYGWRSYLIGLISGRFYTVVVLCVLVFLFFRQKVYLFMSGYIFFGTVAILDSDRLLLEFITTENYVKMGPWLIPISVLLLSVLTLLFTDELFRINGKKMIASKSIRIFAIAQIVYAAYCLILFFYFLHPKEMPLYYTICHYLGIANMALVVLVCLFQIRESPGFASFVLTANLLLAVGVIVFLVTRLGYSKFLPHDMSFLIYGLTFNVLIIIIGLVYQFFTTQETKIRLLTEQNQVEQQMVKMTIEAQDKERQRIAKDLHDDLGSNLSMIKLRMELLMENQQHQNGNNQSLEELHQMLDGACKDLRYISHELMPADVSTKVMRTMIEELAEKLSMQQKVAIRYHVDDIPILSIDAKVNIFRIIKELMNNILKHAQATAASIHLFHIQNSSTVTLEISDNGKGMPKEVLEGKSKGMGLKNLKNRVDYLNGKLNIQSSGLGTLIKVEIPLESNQLAYEENDTDRR